MENLKDLKDLFHHQLRDVYSAETQLIEALPKMKDQANHKELKNAITEHLEETKQHKKRLDEIADNLGIDLSGETCDAMQGLIEEAKSFVSEDASNDVKDAGIIADAQRIEHYEISAYGTLTHYANVLNNSEVADILSEILQQERHADELLNKIAKENINLQAKETA